MAEAQGQTAISTQTGATDATATTDEATTVEVAMTPVATETVVVVETAEATETAVTHPRQKLWFLSESAVYGLILVSALLVITGNRSDTSWAVFIKVFGTVVIFLIAHIFAHVISQLGAAPSGPIVVTRVVRRAVSRSIGLLVIAIIPLTIILFGAMDVITDDTAVWLALFVDTALLAVFGYLGFAHWTPSMPLRIVGAVMTALLGVIIIMMKAFVH